MVIYMGDLTQRETEIITALMTGLTYKQIAVAFHIKTKTVRAHLFNIREKLDAKTTVRAVMIAREKGLIPPQEISKGATR